MLRQEIENGTNPVKIQKQLKLQSRSRDASHFPFANSIDISNNEHVVLHTNESLISAVSVLSRLLQGLIAKITLCYIDSVPAHLGTLFPFSSIPSVEICKVLKHIDAKKVI